MWLIAIAAVIVLLGFLLLWFMKPRRLSGTMLRKITGVWILAEKVPDPARRIIEADKVLDAALSALGFTGSLGEKLQKAGPRFTNLNDVWAAHKLRNHIAHDIHAKMTEEEAASAMRKFRGALKDLGMV